jgi:hypothetical protein
MDDMGGACSTNGREKRYAYRILVGVRRKETSRKRRCEDNIKMNLKDIRYCDLDWIYLPQVKGQWRAILNIVMNRVP